MVHYFLVVAMRKTFPKTIVVVLIKLGDLFLNICSKVVKIQDFDQLQKKIIEILCRFEMTFIPNLFWCDVYLTIHLVDETKLGGLVHCGWMFPIEQDLCKLKFFVRNQSRLEESIAE